MVVILPFFFFYSLLPVPDNFGLCWFRGLCSQVRNVSVKEENNGFIKLEVETTTWALYTSKSTDHGGAYCLGSARVGLSGKENSLLWNCQVHLDPRSPGTVCQQILLVIDPTPKHTLPSQMPFRDMELSLVENHLSLVHCFNSDKVYFL